MINKKVQYTPKGANQDITKSKHSNEFYYDGQHIKILATDSQSTGSVTNEKGNKLKVAFPNIFIDPAFNKISYDNKEIDYSIEELNEQVEFLPTTLSDFTLIGNTITRDSLVLFTTSSSLDVIWKVNNILEEDGDYELEVLYIRDLNFSKEFPIQALFNYENENIQKVYWADGNNQLRFLNITYNQIEGNSIIMDIESTNINFVGDVNFTQAEVDGIISGGIHTSGMIQYTYNLYNLNGSQTKIAPLSELVALDKGNNSGGGEVNEVVGSTPKVLINNIDQRYSHIKIYAIKYTSFAQIPKISLINESELDSSSFTYYDTGSTINDLPLLEFLFLGSDPTIPKHIESKDNRLLFANIKSKNFLIPEDLDFRAYSFPENSTTTQVVDEVQNVNSTGNVINSATTSVNNTYSVPKSNSSINPNYTVNSYTYNSTTKGGEGKYLKYELSELDNENNKNDKYFKYKEIYRIGIQFYNKLGQKSLPQWIGDFQNPINNLEGTHAKLKVSLKQEFYDFIDNFTFESEDDIPVGYKILRAERNEQDKNILCQGILNPMMFQVTGSESDFDTFKIFNNRLPYQDTQLKMPGYISRTFDVFPNYTDFPNQNLRGGRIGKTKHLMFIGSFNDNDIEQSSYEISHGTDDSSTFLHTSMMQMYSPEIQFNKGLTFGNNLFLSSTGLLRNTSNGVWGREIFANSNVNKNEGKSFAGLHPGYIDSTDYIIDTGQDNGFESVFDLPDVFNPYGPVGNTGNDETFNAHFYYRQYNEFNNNTSLNGYSIYGSPEIAEEGQGKKAYNNDGKFEYKNNLRDFYVGGDEPGKNNLLDIQSNGAKSAVIVLGNTSTPNTENRNKLENLYDDMTIASKDPNSIILAELRRPLNYKYFGNIYSGNSIEQKKRTTYVEIGTYTNLSSSFTEIKNPGDTFVQNYKCLRINRTNQEGATPVSQIISEIIEFPVETQINLKNRNDASINEWDSDFLPLKEEYDKYNLVYSQNSNLIKSNDVDFTFRRIDEFDSRIQATKVKVPNESIDSWTDLLSNEVMDLNGKFGPINSILTFKDNLYSFQDEAIAAITVNPRIQVQSNDGVGIELGTGNVLYDFNYLTTTSGAVNKWGITTGKRGIYYYDLLNKGIGRVPDSTNILLSDTKGFHTWFNNNYDYELLKEDNPLNNNGVVFGKDIFNGDIFMTLLQEDKSFTRVFNENIDYFVDLKTYLPTMYMNKGNKLFFTNGNNIYENYVGDYNLFNGQYQDSFITLVVNPASNQDTVFNNIFYNSEVYLQDIDQPEETLTHIQAFNEYQNSGVIPLIVGRNSNLRRKFREWKANIPRNNRNRIRNPWIFLKLYFENKNNYKLILHDIVVNYSI